MTTYTADPGPTTAIYTAGSGPTNQPLNIMLAKYGSVWHFDTDPEPEPNQADSEGQ